MTLRPAVERLRAAGVPDPARDARVLFDWAYAGGAKDGPQDRDQPNRTTLDLFEIAVTERAARRPVSQIIGRRAFWRHEFIVTGDVLDPRPDTETLVERALSAPFARLLDLGTGSGCIVLSLLAERPEAQAVAVDLSASALTVARANAVALGVAERLELREGDWFSGIDGLFDLIVSNPPYIAAEEMADLAPEVRGWEPRMALTDEADGQTAYRRIAEGALAHLTPGGRLLVEIGPTQAAAVAGLFGGAGLVDIAVTQDIDGRDRVVEARRPA